MYTRFLLLILFTLLYLLKSRFATQKGSGVLFNNSLLRHVTMDPPPTAYDLVHREVVYSVGMQSSLVSS